MCRPNYAGGIGLKYPSILNKVLGEKIWWRWLKRLQELWAHLWRKNYSSSVLKKDLIRCNGQILGSLIWNVARNNKGLVTDHAF